MSAKRKGFFFGGGVALLAILGLAFIFSDLGCGTEVSLGDNGQLDTPVCMGQQLVPCANCWINPDNTWCCTVPQPDGSHACGIDSSTCKFTACGANCDNTCLKPPPNPGGATNIKITNSTSEDVTIAFVTGAAGGACPDITQMISYQDISDNNSWCMNPTQSGGDANAGFCTGTIPANSSFTVKRPPSSNIKCLTGGIGLGGKASCVFTMFPNGWTQGEFTLNPTATTVEGVDISLVNGVNYKLSINLPGDGWHLNDGTKITGTIGPNGPAGDNRGKNVFPVNCTDCIRLVGPKVCPGFPDDPTCQDSEICQVLRGVTGDTVEYVIGDLIP